MITLVGLNEAERGKAKGNVRVSHEKSIGYIEKKVD